MNGFHTIQLFFRLKGTREKLLDSFSEDADLQDVSMDGTVIRVHACAQPERIKFS
jgi:hypothetical protein